MYSLSWVGQVIEKVENGKKIGLRFRHRIAHIFIPLAVILIAVLALCGMNTTNPPMAITTALALILLGALELFEAFNLDS